MSRLPFLYICGRPGGRNYMFCDGFYIRFAGSVIKFVDGLPCPYHKDLKL